MHDHGPRTTDFGLRTTEKLFRTKKMSKLHYAIGVDLGGTTIKTGVVDSNGKIIFQTKLPTLGEQGPKIVVAQIQKSIKEVMGKAKGKSLRGI